MFDSALVYMDGPPHWQMYDIDKAGMEVDGEFTNYFYIDISEALTSHIYDCSITNTEMRNGGSIITVMNANLDVENLSM